MTKQPLTARGARFSAPPRASARGEAARRVETRRGTLKRAPRAFAALLLLAPALFAGETRTWNQSDYSDFEKGVVQNLSTRSDGLLTLAPRSRELFDASSAYLWALAQDSKGNLYAGGGTGAKIYQIPPGGKGKLLAELDALEVHAIAVDSKDRVYAATSPDGKVYRIAANGKPEVFYDPKAKYIWGLVFDSKGNLYIATGDRGEVYRVTPDGKGKVFLETGETHVRSMALDSADNLIVGTDPGGIVMRISPAGQGFVLYQMSRREVTAVALARDGAIYAAAVGARPTAAPPAQTPPPPTAAAPAPVVANPQAGAPAAVIVRPSAAVAAPLASATAGGSEVCRIDPDGSPRLVWSNTQDVVYALAFDAAERVLIGAGNKGSIYRIESPTLYTVLLTEPASQITAFQSARDGRLFAATGNVGKVYEIGPALEREGSIESDVFDAAMFTLWGRLSFDATLNGGNVSLVTRSGNLDAPRQNWSPWSAPPITDPKGARITSPAARFVQWRATLAAAPSGASPELAAVWVAYLPKNEEPRIDRIEMTPANYKFPASIAPMLQPQQSLSLPPLAAQEVRGATSPKAPAAAASTNTPALQFAKGHVGARWVASDPNGDSLVYTVEIRGAHETEWKPLRKQILEKYLSWDSSSYPDGEYVIRVTASDAPSNPPSEALTARAESDIFIIDNTAPSITGLAATRNGGKLEVRWHAADSWNDISQAEYSLDGAEWTLAAPVTKLSDSLELDYALAIGVPAGEHTVAVRVKDDYDNEAVEKTVVQK